MITLPVLSKGYLYLAIIIAKLLIYFIFNHQPNHIVLTIMPASMNQFLQNSFAEGVSLLELLVALSILSIIMLIAIPGYQFIQKNSDNSTAMSDIREIEMDIERFRLVNNKYPDDLNQLGFSKLDPWDNPYQYLNFDNVKGKGKFRKDKNLVPINSDFDLYSMGPDGRSVSPLTAKHSRDDIIRANNGKFIGIAEDY